jgi:hypothetical protein
MRRAAAAGGRTADAERLNVCRSRIRPWKFLLILKMRMTRVSRSTRSTARPVEARGGREGWAGWGWWRGGAPESAAPPPVMTCRYHGRMASRSIQFIAVVQNEASPGPAGHVTRRAMNSIEKTMMQKYSIS